jgi:hypothetical protein
MTTIASNSLRRRIGRLRLLSAKSDEAFSGPSDVLLGFLTTLNGMSKEQLAEVRRWRVGVGD